MNQVTQQTPTPKSQAFTLAPMGDSEQLDVLPTVAEVGVDTEFNGVVRVGGMAGTL
jgi:hypothetical protein